MTASLLLPLIEQLWLQQQFTTVLVTHDVEEAVVLADRVILVEAGQVAMDLPVSLQRPRRRGNPTLAVLVERILQRLLSNKLPQTLTKLVVISVTSTLSFRKMIYF